MQDNKKLEFYFDFSSSYGYLATLFVDDLARDIGRELIWKPYLMGAAMKITGVPVTLEVPIKRDYVGRDVARYCEHFGVKMKTPDGFPFSSVAASRVFYVLTDDQPSLAADWCKSAAKAAWEAGKNLSDWNIIQETLLNLDIEPGQVAARIREADVKERLRKETDGAIQRGLWGSPHFIVDEHDMYWGCDKRFEIRNTYSIKKN